MNIGGERGVAQEQMSACTRRMHIRHIIAILRHYQQSQMVATIGRCLDVAIISWQREDGKEEMTSCRYTGQLTGPQAAADSTEKQVCVGLPKRSIFKGSLYFFTF